MASVLGPVASRSVLRAHAAAAACSALAMLVSPGCHDARACHPGDWVACRCDGGSRGFAPCNVEAEEFGDCRCDGVPGLEERQPGQEGALYATCEEDADCDSGLCYGFNARGPHCTRTCDDADDCPAPSPGCNGKGVCKIE